MNRFLPHQHIDKKLLFRLGIFLVVGLAMLGFVANDILRHVISVPLAGIGFVAGLLVGYAVGRVLTVKWHETKQQAIIQTDIVAFLAIGAYIALRAGENFIASEFLSAATLSSLSLAILAGALIGRLLGLRMSIMKLIEANVPKNETAAPLSAIEEV